MQILSNKWLVGIFLFFLSIGLIGMFTPFEGIVTQLSAANLLLTITLVFISYISQWKRFMVVVSIAFLIGFVAELIGVHTGWLFGRYSYESNLGVKIAGVPILIGLNWAILSLGAWEISKFILEKWLRILYAALLLVTFDYVMEPVAVYLNFWQWKSGLIPFSNYLTWFIVSSIILWVYSNFPKLDNKITKVVFIAQFIFFLILNFKGL